MIHKSFVNSGSQLNQFLSTYRKIKIKIQNKPTVQHYIFIREYSSQFKNNTEC